MWYIMDVALLPSGPIQTAEALASRQRLQERVVLELVDMEHPDFIELADKLAKGDRKKAKRWRQRFRRWIHEEYFQNLVASYSRGELQLATPGVTAALVRRAVKGNVPAIKLAMEASGFHNPRVQHEHSGEIQISIKGLPRPERTEDITDATVVEED